MVVLDRQAQSTTAAGQAVLVCTLTKLESQDKPLPDWYLFSSLLESLQDKQCTAMLAGQVKGPHDFCSFPFRTWFAMGPMQTWFGKNGTNPGSTHVPWDNAPWDHWQNCNHEPGSENLT